MDSWRDERAFWLLTVMAGSTLFKTLTHIPLMVTSAAHTTPQCMTGNPRIMRLSPSLATIYSRINAETSGFYTIKIKKIIH